MTKIKKTVLLVIYFVFLAIIVFNFGMHAIRTVEYNKKVRHISGAEEKDSCSFDIHFRGGTSDSWLKRDVKVRDQICTLKGITFDGVFINNGSFDVSDWNLRIDINEDCYLNNAWCGTVEIHQGNWIQTLDLRNIKSENVMVDGFYVGQDFLIPLEAGDYLVYYPSAENNELPVKASTGLPGSVTVGCIFYIDANRDFNIADYGVDFKFCKNVFQGTEPIIFIVLMAVWIGILILILVFKAAYKKAAREAEISLNLQRMEDMKSYNEKLNADVQRKTAHIREIQQKVVAGLANVIGNRDPDTGGHVKRTSDIIKIIVEEYRLQHKDLISDEMADDICRAAPMHDLGKIYIDTSILCKPGRLTDEEFGRMKKHSENSGEIVKLVLKGVEEPHFVNVAYNVARHHHERWDGKGYPDHLKETEIPIEARLMAVADVYDALVSKRCYKKEMGFEEASNIMCEGMGSQFDPEMKEIFLACRERLEDYYRKQ